METNKDKKDQELETDQSKQLAELQQAMKALQEQNKQLLQQQELSKQELLKAKQAEEQAKKQKEQEELEASSDLAKLLKGLGEEEEEPKSKKSLDQLSNQELLEVVSGSIEKFVDARFKLAKEESEKSQDGFLKKLDGIESAVGQMIAMSSVSDLRARYPDLDQYKEDIAVLLKETPGLSIEKAYKLAKAERLDKEPAPSQVETEVPTVGLHGLRLSKQRRGESEAHKTGAHENATGLPQFRSFLSDGIDRIIASKQRR